MKHERNMTPSKYLDSNGIHDDIIFEQTAKCQTLKVKSAKLKKHKALCLETVYLYRI